MKARIEELFCFAFINNDIEGVPAFQNGDLIMPMMGADLERMESMKVIARKMQKDTGQKVRLYKFTQKEELLWDEDVQ